MENNIEKLLERIAVALESISDKLNMSVVKYNDTQNYFKPKRESETDSIGDKKISIEIDNANIIEFLEQKNITVKFVKPQDEIDEVLDSISLFMGDRYSRIKKIYNLIKKHMNTGGRFQLDMKNYQQEDVASITQLCTNLHQIAFLEEYKYHKSPRFILRAKVNRIPKALNFFSGGWLERYIKTAIIKNISNYPIRYSYLKNPQILMPNGDDFELDILFNIENEIFWFEAKTGEYQKHIQKYSNVAKILELDFQHSFMILSDITETAAATLKSMFNMTVYRIDDFSERFKENIAHIIENRVKELGNNNNTTTTAISNASESDKIENNE